MTFFFCRVIQFLNIDYKGLGREVYGKPELPSNDLFYSTHLVECDGELSLCSSKTREVGFVFSNKINRLNMKWVQANSLGNHTLFIVLCSCLLANTSLKVGFIFQGSLVMELFSSFLILSMEPIWEMIHYKTYMARAST